MATLAKARYQAGRNSNTKSPMWKKKQALFPGANCVTCPLSKKRYALPSRMGKADSQVAFIGEGPGANELSQKEAFVGDTGIILRAGIEDLGLDQLGAYLTNTTMCDPRGIEKGGEEWNQAVEACRPRLALELQNENPELLVVMGNEAKSSLMPHVRRKIQSLSGTFDYSEEFKKDVLFTFHPAFIIHAREGERYFTQWLDHLNEGRLYFQEEPLEVEVKIARTAADVLTFCRELNPHSKISVDVETTSFSPFDTGAGVTSGGRGFEYGKLLCISLSGDGEIGYVVPVFLLEFKTARAALAKLLLSHRVMCHNAPFDVPFLKKYVAEGILISDDTMFKSYATDETPFHGLKRLARKHLGIEDWSRATAPYTLTRGESFANIPDDILFPYAGLDAAVTRQLDEAIVLDEPSQRLYDKFLIPVSNMFVDMSVKGTPINPKTLVAASRELETLKQGHQKALLKDFGIKNPNSWKQVFKVLWDDLELDIPETVKTGKNFLETLQVAPEFKDQVEDWQWAASEIATNVIGYRSAHKGRNTYIKGVAQALNLQDLRIHPDFKLFATVTGRIVISSPSITNYTKATTYADLIRMPFVPQPGYVWFHYDYKQFELRIYAVISGDIKMVDVLTVPGADGKMRDPHHEVALVIYGPEYPEMNEKAFGLLRTITKTCVFGRLYGRGPFAMAVQLEIPGKEAERVCRAIDSFWDLETYRKYITSLLDNDQQITNPLGRSRRFPLITQDNFHRCFNQACNGMIQSTASDLNLLALHRIWTEMGDDVHPFFTIHDSGDMEIRADKVDELLPRILDILREEPRRQLGNTVIPFEVDYVIGECWKAA